MLSVLSIDWLSLCCYGIFDIDTITNTIVTNPMSQMSMIHCCTTKLLPYNSRQFKEIYQVSYNSEPFAEIQAKPFSEILKSDMLIIKFTNNQLYKDDFFSLADDFLNTLNIQVHNVSRVDICNDFDTFLYFSPEQLIERYMAGKYKHIGRQQGNTFFRNNSLQSIAYNGLKFGKGDSSTSIYLYNKTLELDQVKDKPYIRDKWKTVGLNGIVWRLEVSIKSSATKFHSKNSKEKNIHITYSMLHNMGQVQYIYFAFVNQMWQFIVYHDNITNITREPRIIFFDTPIKAKRWIISQKRAHTFSDKITIKQLYLSSSNNKFGTIISDEGATKLAAVELAENTNLMDWYIRKHHTWENSSE